MRNIFFIIIVLGLLAGDALAQAMQNQRKMQVFGLGGDEVNYKCKRLPELMVGTIVDVPIVGDDGLVTSINLRTEDGDLKKFNFAPSGVRSLDARDSQLLSWLLTKGRKISARVFSCPAGKEILYAVSVREM